MSFGLLVRILAGLVVTVFVGLTLLMVRHLRHEPVGGIFSEVVPVVPDSQPLLALPDARSELALADPGMKVFERARELMAVGDLVAARDRLQTIVSIYPRSGSASEARRILGEMNLDELLSRRHFEDKKVYKVVRGDSYLKIAANQRTNLDMIMYLNGLSNFHSLQPGQEVLILPLDFNLRIEPDRKVLSLWDQGEFVKEYPLQKVVGTVGRELKTSIDRTLAIQDGRSVGPASPAYRGASKRLQLADVPWVVAALPADGDTKGLARGFYLGLPEMEELALLTRSGNPVEIRLGTD